MIPSNSHPNRAQHLECGVARRVRFHRWAQHTAKSDADGNATGFMHWPEAEMRQLRQFELLVYVKCEISKYISLCANR